MSGGYIKIHRQLLNWEWWDDANTTRLWIYLLLDANYEDKKWMGTEIKRGQLITSLDHLSVGTGLSIQQVRTCLTRLKSTSEITVKTTNKYSLVTICKYDDYQVDESDDQQAKQPARQQSNNNQITTTEENKEIYKETTPKGVAKKVNADKSATLPLEERRQAFYESLIPFVPEYGKQMIRSFYDYWSQVNPNGKKMLWEMQRAFELKRRLSTWKQKDEDAAFSRSGGKAPAQRPHIDAETEYHDGTI